MSLTDKLESLTNQAKSISSQMSSINMERSKYEGCIIIHRQKGSRNTPSIGLISNVDFVHGSVSYRTAYGDRCASAYLNQLEYEIVSKEEMLSRLK